LGDTIQTALGGLFICLQINSAEQEFHPLMNYNFKLFWRMALRSFVRTRGTHGQLTRKRLFFVLLFYSVWPAWAVFTGLCFWLDDILFPDHKTQPVDKPLFIIGNFRSGSTFLHRLLSRDDGTFTSLRTWDIFITPTITQRKIAAFFARMDRALGGHLKRLLFNLDKRSLGQVKIHRISFFEPEEDENILIHNWSTFFINFMFPFLEEMPPYTYFDEQLPNEEKRRIMSFYRSCIQRHIYADGGKRHFVSKNPAFSAKIETLMEFFPDARVLYLARNPLEMLPSTASWLGYAWGVFSTMKEKYPYQDEILALTQHWYRHPLSYLDANPSPNNKILSYDELITNPENVIRSFYRQFGYMEHRGLEKIIVEAVEETRNYKSDHQYSLEHMSYTREQILVEFADVFERFGFETGEFRTVPSLILEPPVPSVVD